MESPSSDLDSLIDDDHSSRRRVHSRHVPESGRTDPRGPTTADVEGHHHAHIDVESRPHKKQHAGAGQPIQVGIKPRSRAAPETEGQPSKSHRRGKRSTGKVPRPQTVVDPEASDPDSSTDSIASAKAVRPRTRRHRRRRDSSSTSEFTDESLRRRQQTFQFFPSWIQGSI